MKQNNTNKADVAPAQGGQHTPGPWKVEFNTEPGIFNQSHMVIANDDDPRAFPDEELVICRLPTGNHSANARLIAAAPELLEALKRLLTLWEEAIGYETDYMDMADFARAAIAKAEGRMQ